MASSPTLLRLRWNAEFHPSMAPVEGDVVVQGKKGLDAFPGTDLEEQLLTLGIETVVLGGFLCMYV